MPAARIGAFDDGVDLFRVWRNDIEVNCHEKWRTSFVFVATPPRNRLVFMPRGAPKAHEVYPEIENYRFEAKFGPTRSNEIEFGAFKGRPKWRRLLDIPDQRIRDGLLNLIVYQGDTEFANQPYSVTGELFSTPAYAEHGNENLPQAQDIKLVHEIQATEPKWVAPKGNMD